MKDDYETTNLYLAAFLYGEKVQLVHVRKVSGKKVVFVFEGGPKAEKLCSAYVDGTARVSPMSYKNCINDLKNLMFRDIPFNGVHDG